MEGLGARSLEVEGGELHGALDYAFSHYSNRAHLEGLLDEISVESIPTWADFSSAVGAGG